MLCYVIQHMLYDKLCYITYVMLNNMLNVLLYNICYVT